MLVLFLVALPLRGYAGELKAPCEAHHDGAAVAQAYVHEHGDSHHDDSGDGSGTATHAASVCSICASCCAGTSLAPDTPHVAMPQDLRSERIAFCDYRASGFVPEHFDRPPLAS